MSTVEKIKAAELNPVHRQANKTLMVAWINANLFNRAHLDVRKSVVLYDDAKYFLAAVDEVPSEKLFQQLYDETPVRYFSIGVI
jgi:hypothetical protein